MVRYILFWQWAAGFVGVGGEMDAYTDFAFVYDELMDNTDYEGWAERVNGLILRYGVSHPERNSKDKLESEKNLVVDLGCGTGNLTEILYRKGYDMMGIDNSEAMLERACRKRDEKGYDILYLLQDMRTLELYSTVGTVVSVCDSINYILEEKELEEVFRLVNNYLYPGGIFIFDFNTDYKYREVIGETVIAENREDCSFIWENYFEEAENINECDLTVFVKETAQEDGLFRKFEETHLQRGYRMEEIGKILENAGLKCLRILDADTDGDVTDKSERILVVAGECQKGIATDDCN